MPAKKKAATHRKKKAVCNCASDIEQIREKAYLLWAAKGYPENSDVENWLEAEGQINA